MRIPCPHCGERDLREFSYLGDATLARPRSERRRRAERLQRLCLSPRQSGRPASRILVSRLRLPGLARRRRATRARTRSSAARSCKADSMSAEPNRSPTKASRIAWPAADRSRAAAALRVSTARPIDGFAGDTLASALLANGIRLVGRSFKYHRPRGILTAGPEEPNALVELRSGARREPNTRATTIELFDGLEAASQNRWPSLRFDLRRVNSLFAPFLPAGFYYKTFMWPAAFWEKVYEPLIRRAAGLGRASGRDRSRSVRASLCVLRRAGHRRRPGRACRRARRRRGRALASFSANEDFAFGGRLLADDSRDRRRPAGHIWARKRRSTNCAACPTFGLMPRTRVFGVYDGGTYGALERVSDHLPNRRRYQPRQRLWRIVAKRAVLAAGAIERPIVFGGNDRPGVMMASAVRTYLNRFAVAPGATHCAASRTTTTAGGRPALAARGVELAAVIDTRPELPAHLPAACAATRVFAGGQVTRHWRRLLHGITVTMRDGARDHCGRYARDVREAGIPMSASPVTTALGRCGVKTSRPLCRESAARVWRRRRCERRDVAGCLPRRG